MTLASRSIHQFRCCRLAGEKDDSRSRAMAPHDSCELYSIHAWHHDISYEDVRTEFVKVCECGPAIIEGGDFKSFVTEDLRERVRYQVLVIHDEHNRLSFRSGRICMLERIPAFRRVGSAVKERFGSSEDCTQGASIRKRLLNPSARPFCKFSL